MLKKAKNYLLDILFPKQCLGCGNEGNFICQNCLPLFEKIEYFCLKCQELKEGRLCFKCQEEIPCLKKLFVFFSWHNLLTREAIFNFKYKNVYELGAELAVLICQELKKSLLFRKSCPKFIFIPMALHRRKMRSRGFNQAEILAKEIAEFFGIEIRNDILTRKFNTLPQMEIKNQEQRRKNIKGAFNINPNFKIQNPKLNFGNKIFVLVDDVCTTGATLNEAAKVLKKLKPQEIWGLVLAR